MAEQFPMEEGFSDFAKGLLEAAEEAAAHMSGEDTEVVVHHVPDPRVIREKYHLTQAEMAPLLGMSLSGYRKLEQGQRSVSGPASVLLQVIDKDPSAVRGALHPA